MAINFDKALGVHERALLLREKRNDLLASNIANADTPGYKARDIDFSAAMGAAQAGSQASLALTKTHTSHLNVGTATAGDESVKYRNPYQPSLDGNTVEGHVEQAEFADNALRYQSTLEFLGGRFSSLKSVLQGGR